LASGIAHEINTPAQFVGDNTVFLKDAWSPILGLVTTASRLCEEARGGRARPETLAEFEQRSKTADVDYLAVEIPRAIEQSLEGIDRITKIVRAMKEFSHPGSKERQPVDINRAIETTIAVARNEWKYVAEIETSFTPNLPPVPCFVGELNQTILILLVNAAQAIGTVVGSSGEKGKITISTRQQGSSVEIAVRDSGEGIPDAIRSRIFEPFFTTKPVGKGTGQGLTLAYATVVKKHGGKIWFDSEVKKGTTFFVQLPLETAGPCASSDSSTGDGERPDPQSAVSRPVSVGPAVL
jgi:two-component system, NtrC family, sensor kinase